MPKTAKTKSAKQLRGGLDATPAQPVDRASLTHEQQLQERLDALATTACSGQWDDEIRSGRTDYPIPGMIQSRCRVLTTGEMVSNNHGEVGTRRWHPLLTDALEDMLDRMPINKAAKYVHPPAVRYDHCTPYREAVVYDPRSIRVDDPDIWILRCVKLGDWPARPGHARQGEVRIRRGRRVLGFVTCQDVPVEPIVDAYVQVTE